MPVSSPRRARIQIEAGYGDDANHRFHNLFTNGQDAGLQVRSVDFHAEGGETCEVRVTFVNPELTIEGFADMIAVTGEEASRG